MGRMTAMLVGGMAAMALGGCVATPDGGDDGAVQAGGLSALSFSTSNGTVSPTYRWDLDFSINAQGDGVLRRCTGYATAGDACRAATFTVPQAERDAIAAAVREGGLADRPARPMANPPIGGGATGASLTVDGQAVVLPPWPIQEDRARVAAVLRAIDSAIPASARTEVGDEG